MKNFKKVKGYAVPVVVFGFEINRTFKSWKAARRFMRSAKISKCYAIFA